MRYLGQASKDLGDALYRLLHNYRQTQTNWNDQVQKKFDHTYMQGYEPAVRSASKQIDSLYNLLNQAEREIP